MLQPEEWSRQAKKILASKARPHFAPAPEVLALHRQLLSEAKQETVRQLRVLILGATPELADLCLELGCHAVRVDNNVLMFEAAALRRQIVDPTQETVIKGNWLDLKEIGDNQIDFVLGDASLNNVPHARMGQLLNELKRVTHTASRLSLRQIIRPATDVPEYDFTAARDAFRCDQLTSKEFYNITRFFSFLAEAYDSDARTLDGAKVFAAYRRKFVTGELSASEFAMLYAQAGNIVHTVYTRVEQQCVLERLGECQVIQPAGGCYYRDLVNIFTVQRRSPVLLPPSGRP